MGVTWRVEIVRMQWIKGWMLERALRQGNAAGHGLQNENGNLIETMCLCNAQDRMQHVVRSFEEVANSSRRVAHKCYKNVVCSMRSGRFR